MKKENIYSESSFFKELLKQLYAIDLCDAISIFQYLENKEILKGFYRISGGFCYELVENIDFISNNQFRKDIISMKPFVYKISNIFHFYYPYEIQGDFDLSNFKKENTIFFRFENFNNKKINKKKIEKAIQIINSKMENFYIVDFNILKNYYSKNINISRKMAEIFTISLKTQDSYKTIISGLQKYLGFDRIRFYVVNENKLIGAYSITMSKKIKAIDYEKIILEKGAHRFSDILLGYGNEDANYNSDFIFYLPLLMDKKPVGLLIFDNLLSRIKITNEEIEILKAFAGQIAMAIDNVNLFNKIQELSLYDELTKLPLRRYFNARFQEEFYRAERFNQPLSILWIDIDYFKEVNDTYGHQIGDKLLKEVGKVINSGLRKIDFPCRYGGDEIIIMLPQATCNEAFNLAKRLSQEIKNIKIDVPFSAAKQINVTTSIGISSYPTDANKMDELLNKADEALYWVKSHGRDSIKTYSEIKNKE